MKNPVYLILMLFWLPALLVAQETRLVKGKVTDGSEPLADVAISIEGEQGGTYTTSEGRYEIETTPGDILTFAYNGMKTVRLRVEDVTRFLNLVMAPEYTELEEVTMQKRLKSQNELQREYPTNERILRSNFGYIEPDATAGSVKIVNGDQINPIGVCLLDYLRNRFANLTVQGNCSNPDQGRVYLRARGSIFRQAPAIFDVDGMVYSSAPGWLDVNLIERMAIIYNRSMAVRYGSIGAGGVIVINTANVNYRVPDSGAQFATANTKKVLSQAEVQANDPTYLKELRAAGDQEAARAVYREYAPRYAAWPYFFLDAYTHFYEQRNDRSFADEIIGENYAKLSGNAVLLKALAYLYQAQRREEKAREVYKEIFILRPEYSQSYLDMANAYRDAGESGKAASLFGRYQYLLKEGFLIGSDTFWPIQQHDSDNLFRLDGEKLGTDMRLVTTDPYTDGATRLIFEWNDSEAEFELQFANPSGGTFAWDHTYAGNSSRIEDEKISGYAIEEYVIDGNTPGTWQINIKYLGNKSLTPTYLKVTTYFNYGTRNQQKQVETFKLFLKGVNHQLMTLSTRGMQ